MRNTLFNIYRTSFFKNRESYKHFPLTANQHIMASSKLLIKEDGRVWKIERINCSATISWVVRN
jgi:hypothetical protein